MLKTRLFLFLFFSVCISYSQQNKLSIENTSSIYNGWDTYFSFNSIASIGDGEGIIYFASYNAIFSYDTSSFQIEKFDTLNEF